MKKPVKNKQIMRLTYIFVGIFVIMMGYFLYFQIFVSEDVINNTYNKRQDVFEKFVTRGNIITESGDVLAKTETDLSGEEVRVYPYENIFSHVVGISSHGKMGIELAFDYNLLAADVNVFEKIGNEFADKKTEGNNIITTLDVELQKSAYNALGDNDGAIIALDPETGKIYAMVSKPDFNPNDINENWDDIVNDEDNSCLLNRATNGLYPPGSTFKIFTLLEYIRENAAYKNYRYNCYGSITVGQNTVRCYNGRRHGEVDAFKAFAHSCNSSFIDMGMRLDIDIFKNTCEELMFNGKLPTTLDYKESVFALNSESTDFEIMQTVIGQGKTQVTPLHMIMIASALANDGLLMKPYYVSAITNHNGQNVKKFSSEKYETFFSENELAIMKQAMNDVVAYGTGTRFLNDVYDVYGKTGTAEIDSGDDAHSWFVGYARKDNKKLAICVLMEKMPPGSTPAVPVAKEVFDSYFN